MSRAFEYNHVVGFEETNLVGNVYYANHVRWQGRCRELFLRSHAPGVLAELSGDLALVTTHVTCEYYAELHAFDEIRVCMKLGEIGPGRIAMSFEYRRAGSRDELVARGEQQVLCMRRSREERGEMEVAEIPPELLNALAPYASTYEREGAA